MLGDWRVLGSRRILKGEELRDSRAVRIASGVEKPGSLLFSWGMARRRVSVTKAGRQLARLVNVVPGV